jgi:predicted ATPase/DNA-binding CsgD family transcriptional regulator
MSESATPPGRLSTREREIVGLVATGKSNRTIAEALYLSERTVERHVSAVFNKLDVHSRAELIAAVFGGALQTDAPSSPDTARLESAVQGRATKTNLPFPHTSLVGREAEIADIVGVLQKSRLVTVTGAGGVGKTRTALAVGDALVDETKGGVWLVELAPLAHGSFMATTVAQVLNVQETPNRLLLDTLIAYLKNKAVLLILDNCEHVIAEAAVVANALLRGCSELRILATSRERLRIVGERSYRLPSLAFPTAEATREIHAEDANAYSAIALFVERAQAVNHRFTLADENAPIVAQICRQLDGIPLAIELAAARVTILPVKDLSDKLNERFRILTSGDRTALPRHQTMCALIDWSYDLLTPPEQRLFERLSVFAGSCTLASASSVCADDGVDELEMLELIVSLVEKSLVVADVGGDEPRYSLLESSRTYAAEKLVGRGEGPLIAHRHARAALELALRIEHDFDTALDPGWPALIEAELENWRSALEWTLIRRGDIELGQRLAAALRPVWVGVAYARVPASEGRRWVRTAVELVDDTTPLDVVAGLDNAEGTIATNSQEFQLALEINKRALARYQELDDKRRTAGVQWHIGQALSALGRPDEAEVWFREALERVRALGTRRLEGAILECIASARSDAGDLVAARAHCDEALAIFRALGDERFAALTLANLAEGEFRAGDVKAAVQLAAESLAAYREGDQSSEQALANMAAYLIATDRYDEARAYACEAIELARELQHSVATAWALQHLAAIAALRPSKDVENSRASHARAARLLGFVDARLAALGAPRQYTEQQEYLRVTTLLRRAVDPAGLESLMRIGATTTEDRAIEEALAVM